MITNSHFYITTDLARANFEKIIFNLLCSQIKMEHNIEQQTRMKRTKQLLH